jgi:Fe2+ or Zn2+ uptake regulation protein
VPTAPHPSTSAVRGRLRAAREGGDAAAALLREAGCRPTAPRLLVLQALAGGEHVDADAVLAHARARYPAINPSTVYRTLDALVAAGLALRSDLGAGRLHYEMAREHRHHHAVCQRCGAVAHLHDATLAPLAEALAADTGYALSPDREITVPGLCPSCRGAGKETGERKEREGARP